MVTIKKATQAQTIAAIKCGDFSTVDTINRKAEKKRTVCNSPVWSLSAARSSPQVTNNLKLMMITTAGNFSAVFRALQK